jgi:Asp-tRNA(Asn)/Glu-tRNA(Gln) amidotransferase A subunit family amidase
MRAMAEELAALPAAEVAAAIAEGRVTAEEYAQACLARVDARDGQIRAFAHLDRDHVLAQARARDEERRSMGPLGPLHGVPVAVKDIIDTAGEPTECGSPILAGRLPWHDAAVVTQLRQAGAVIFGKTVTTEYAYFNPGPTRNPHDPERTPGGSSSGSAAAVAAGMVPLAVGTQTNGSVIRPAAFCGVVGFKPTHGLIPRTGILALSRTLDQVGVFARTIEDAALLAEALAGYHEGDPDTRPRARPPLRATALGDWPLPPRFAFVRSPAWEHAEAATIEAFEELKEALGDAVAEVELGPTYAKAYGFHRIVMESEMAHNLRTVQDKAGERLSPVLRQLLDRGRAHRAFDYLEAVAGIRALGTAFEGLFDEYNAVITPAAPGEAPRGLDSTGNPVFATLWTALGVPAVTVPLLRGPSGMPMGVQVVAPRGDDARLLRSAQWLAQTLGGGGRRRKGRKREGAAAAGRSSW